jgi:hypothetical protein
MDNQEINKPDCNCNSDCCQPKKNKLWMKIVFIAVVLAAVAIVTVKLVVKSGPEPGTVCDSISNANSACCDTSGMKNCVKITDPSKNKSCCPKSKQ